MLSAASAAKAESPPSVGLGMDLRLASDKLARFSFGTQRAGSPLMPVSECRKLQSRQLNLNHKTLDPPAEERAVSG